MIASVRQRDHAEGRDRILLLVSLPPGTQGMPAGPRGFGGFMSPRNWRALRTTAVVTALTLVGSVIGSAAWATPDWNLGNTQVSQISNLNAQATGPIRDAGLGMCLDDKGGATAPGTPAGVIEP